jgi:hypothetical protein
LLILYWKIILDLLLIVSMAKRMTSCRAWHWLRNVRAAGLTFTLMAGLCSGHVLHAAGSIPSNSPSSNTITAALEYQETDYGVVNWSISLTTQTVPFKNEPAAAGKTVRGVLNFGDNPGNAIAFVWQRGDGKLFLDLNRNQDLTDDSAGVFSARGTKAGNYQSFAGIHLPLTTTQGRCQMLVDLDFYDYGARPNCSLSARCFWQGKVTLHGQDWQVGAIPSVWAEKNGGRNISLEHHLLLRPWEQHNQAFNNFNGSLETVPFSQKLFFGGQAYQLDWLAAAPNGEVKPGLRFTEQSVTLGDLKITGQYIQRLVLPGETCQVVLDRPAATVKVPTGSYNQPDVRLEQGGTVAYLNFNRPPSGNRISVDGKTPAVLDVGGPLTNSVLASRHGQDLRLDYRLIGAGGATYQLAEQNRSHPPEFAVFKGGKKIASGNFEFG